MRLGTRGSALALSQAELIRDRLEALGEEVEIVVIKTSGDERPAGRLPAEIQDKERFVKEIEDALLDDRIDLAVHSAKDVPGVLPDGLALAGVPDRSDARDAMCGVGSVSALTQGAVVGTASVRRRSQLLARRPDLDVREVRGNVDTRLSKLSHGDYDALVLAAAGLRRLGRSEGEPIAHEEMLPAPGQGCLALEARDGDTRVREIAVALTDQHALVALTAERALVAGLQATCDTPVGAFAREQDGVLRLDGYAGAPDGSAWVRDTLDGDPSDPAALGAAVAKRMLASGASDVLSSGV